MNANVGDTVRISYIADSFTSGLTDVQMYVRNPNGSTLGVYTLDEWNGDGIYYYDFDDADIAGTYLFVVNSVTKPKKDAKKLQITEILPPPVTVEVVKKKRKREPEKEF